MAACAACRGRVCELGLSCPHVTFVLPGKPDECPQGEFAPGEQHREASGHAQGQPGGEASLPLMATSPDPSPGLRSCGVHVCFHTSRTGVGSNLSFCPSLQLHKSPLAAALPT